MAPSPYIKEIQSQEELTALAKDKQAILIDFHATWCGPCHMIAPVFSQLADQYRTVAFVKVDVDNVPQVAQQYAVSAMPTFVMIKNGSEVKREKGADPRKLKQLLDDYAPKADTTVASGSGDGPAAGDMSLLEYLDLQQVNCLNESSDHNIKSIVGKKSRNLGQDYLESDADEQLLINLVFNQVVRIRSIVLHTKTSSQGPKRIKIDINKSAIGFNDIENASEPEVVQDLDVQEDLIKDGKQIQLRFVKLQRVNTLHIFVSSNHGGTDTTRIDAIDVFGQPVATTQMSGLKKSDHDH